MGTGMDPLHHEKIIFRRICHDIDLERMKACCMLVSLYVMYESLYTLVVYYSWTILTAFNCYFFNKEGCSSKVIDNERILCHQ